MGLAASQARLLLLTSRKSDLEYRAQQITNSIMILAQQTEQVAREYSIKISNQTIMYTDATDRDQLSQSVTASTLGAIAGGAYKLQMKDSNGQWHDWYTVPDDEYPWIDGSGKPITAAQYEALPESDKKNCTTNYRPATDADMGRTDIPVSWLTNDFTGPEILEGYNNGSMRIVDANGQEIDLNSNNGFVTTYYTDDDKAAEADYNTKTASIQVKEKRLQNDLNQIQTQQSACDTEIDSVKKILDKNIERTFKVFS